MRLPHLPPPPEGGEPLPVAAVLPGLALILAMDLAPLLGLRGAAGALTRVWTPAALALPWLTILVLRRRPSALGYVRGRALAEYGWGMLAGAIWRGLGMAANAVWFRAVALGPSLPGLLGALVWVPLIEETFYRGYLGPAFSRRFGRWAGILIQAALFTLHPGHWSQGWPAVAGILAFGVTAGWLVESRRTIWIAWGAHGLANLIPALLALFA